MVYHVATGSTLISDDDFINVACTLLHEVTVDSESAFQTTNSPLTFNDFIRMACTVLCDSTSLPAAEIPSVRATKAPKSAKKSTKKAIICQERATHPRVRDTDWNARAVAARERDAQTMAERDAKVDAAQKAHAAIREKDLQDAIVANTKIAAENEKRRNVNYSAIVAMETENTASHVAEAGAYANDAVAAAMAYSMVL
jgi:uncharacterized protein involved in type VI secretion and phage assembly